MWLMQDPQAIYIDNELLKTQATSVGGKSTPEAGASAYMAALSS
jgi:hypothetical protein